MDLWSSNPEDIKFVKGTVSLYNGKEISQHEFYMPEDSIYEFKKNVQDYLINKDYPFDYEYYLN